MPTLNSPEVLAETAVIRQQLTDLEDQLIELDAEAARLVSSAEARDAFVLALRAPLNEPVGSIRTAASSPLAAPGPNGPVVLADLAAAVASNGSEGAGEAFFDADVDPEPARKWLLAD